MTQAFIGEDGVPVCGICRGKLSSRLENYGNNSQGFFFVKKCSRCKRPVQYGVTFDFQKRFSGILLSTNENMDAGSEEVAIEDAGDVATEGGEIDADSNQEERNDGTIRPEEDCDSSS